MIKESADYFESIAGDLGISVKIPRPGKTARRFSAAANSIVSAGLITAGITTSSKALIGLGIIGLTGSAILLAER